MNNKKSSQGGIYDNFGDLSREIFAEGVVQDCLVGYIQELTLPKDLEQPLVLQLYRFPKAKVT